MSAAKPCRAVSALRGLSVLGRFYLPFVVVALFLAGSAAARTLVVSQSGDGDFEQLGAAIEAAASGDTILIQPGRYADPDRDRALRSETDLVILGVGASPQDCVIVGLWISLWDGGTLAVRDLTFAEQKVGQLNLDADQVEVTRCRFEHCEVGLKVVATDASVVACTFRDNHPIAPMALGGLDISLSGEGLVSDCVFINTSGFEGGALTAIGDISVRNCIFWKNQLNPSETLGGGIIRMENRGSVENCTFLENDASGFAAIWFIEGVDVTHTIFAGTRNGGPILCGWGPRPQCCCFWDNDYDSAEFCGGPAELGDFIADPLFCNPSTCDVGLLAGSPCLPGNHGGRNCGLIGAVGQQCGLVATRSTTWGALKARYGTVGRGGE